MWRAASVCQTSRFIQWEQARPPVPPSAMHRTPTAPCWNIGPIVPFLLKTKWLRIDCSNLFTQRWDGYVSHPKITLKSDYIQFLTPGRSHFSSRLLLCIFVCDCVLLWLCGMHAFLSTLFFFLYFRRQSCAAAWN